MASPLGVQGLTHSDPPELRREATASRRAGCVGRCRSRPCSAPTSPRPTATPARCGAGDGVSWLACLGTLQAFPLLFAASSTRQACLGQALSAVVISGQTSCHQHCVAGKLQALSLRPVQDLRMGGQCDSAYIVMGSYCNLSCGRCNATEAAPPPAAEADGGADAPSALSLAPGDG